jgi:hypothetical protein
VIEAHPNLKTGFVGIDRDHNEPWITWTVEIRPKIGSWGDLDPISTPEGDSDYQKIESVRGLNDLIGLEPDCSFSDLVAAIREKLESSVLIKQYKDLVKRLEDQVADLEKLKIEKVKQDQHTKKLEETIFDLQNGQKADPQPSSDDQKLEIARLTDNWNAVAEVVMGGLGNPPVIVVAKASQMREQIRRLGTQAEWHVKNSKDLELKAGEGNRRLKEADNFWEIVRILDLSGTLSTQKVFDKVEEMVATTKSLKTSDASVISTDPPIPRGDGKGLIWFVDEVMRLFELSQPVTLDYILNEIRGALEELKKARICRDGKNPTIEGEPSDGSVARAVSGRTNPNEVANTSDQAEALAKEYGWAPGRNIDVVPFLEKTLEEAVRSNSDLLLHEDKRSTSLVKSLQEELDDWLLHVDQFQQVWLEVCETLGFKGPEAAEKVLGRIRDLLLAEDDSEEGHKSSCMSDHNLEKPPHNGFSKISFVGLGTPQCCGRLMIRKWEETRYFECEVCNHRLDLKAFQTNRQIQLSAEEGGVEESELTHQRLETLRRITSSLDTTLDRVTRESAHQTTVQRDHDNRLKDLSERFEEIEKARSKEAQLSKESLGQRNHLMRMSAQSLNMVIECLTPSSVTLSAKERGDLIAKVDNAVKALWP